MRQRRTKRKVRIEYKESVNTYYENDISILSLHPRGRARVLVSSKVLRIDDSYDSIKRERTVRLTLEFADLESEGSWESGPTATTTIQYSNVRCCYGHCLQHFRRANVRAFYDDTVWILCF